MATIVKIVRGVRPGKWRGTRPTPAVIPYQGEGVKDGMKCGEERDYLKMIENCAELYDEPKTTYISTKIMGRPQ